MKAKLLLVAQIGLASLSPIAVGFCPSLFGQGRQVPTTTQPERLQVEGRLVRDTFTLSGTALPAWNIELKYTNLSSEPVQLMDTLILLASSSTTSTFAGVHITRSPADTSLKSQHVQDRYGLTWGIEVPPTGSAFWPFGALPGISTLNSLLFMLATSSVDALPGGGYGSPIDAGTGRIIKERILFPFDSEANGERDAVILVPPVARLDERILMIFDVKGLSVNGQEYQPRIETMPSDAQELKQIVTNDRELQWPRVIALNMLAELHPTQSEDPLVSYALDGSLDPLLRIPAILNLGVWKVPRAATTLAAIVQKEVKVSPRLAAIAALGRLGDESTSPVLRPLMDDKDDVVARFATDAVGSINDKEAVPKLLALLANGKRESLLGPTANALVSIGDDTAKKGVLSMLADRDAKDKARESIALAVSRVSWAVGTLSAIAVDEKDKDSVRRSAVLALEQASGNEALTALKGAAGSRRKDVREAASAALQRLSRRIETPQ